MRGDGGAALIEELWRQHLAREPQWILILAAALPAALAFFTLLASRARAHLRSLGDLIRFFFAVFTPELFTALLGKSFYEVVRELQVGAGRMYDSLGGSWTRREALRVAWFRMLVSLLGLSFHHFYLDEEGYAALG